MFKSPVKSKKKSQHQTKLKIIQCVLIPVLSDFLLLHKQDYLNVKGSTSDSKFLREEAQTREVIYPLIVCSFLFHCCRSYCFIVHIKSVSRDHEHLKEIATVNLIAGCYHIRYTNTGSASHGTTI